MSSLPAPFGKYELLTRVAAGGMAEIFLARTRSIQGFEKYLVIKKILRNRTNDPDFVRMFLDEARVAATLDHPNIVQIYDVGHIDGEYFIAMEYLRGHNLLEIIRAGATLGEATLPIAHAITILAGACAGLHYAHEKHDFQGRPLGIVHRDITPQNIMVSFDGATKIVDFGIAKAVSREVETAAGTLKGKIGYMSPEQCRGQPVDPRSDLFSLGVILYEMTVGMRLYREKSEFETLRKIVEGPVPAPLEVVPTYPRALNEIVVRCLQKQPADRYQSARQLHADLEELARDQRLVSGVVPVAQYMERLFAAEIAADREAGGTGLFLAAHSSSGSGPNYFGEARRTATTIPITAARQRHLRARLVRAGALAVGLVAVILVGWRWTLHRDGHKGVVVLAGDAVADTAAAAVEPSSAAAAAPAVDASELTGPGDAAPTLARGDSPPSPDPSLPLAPTVLCRLLIDAQGAVIKSQIFRSRLELAPFEDAALQAVQRYRFTPARRGGKPVAAWINWPVTFANGGTR